MMFNIVILLHGTRLVLQCGGLLQNKQISYVYFLVTTILCLSGTVDIQVFVLRLRDTFLSVLYSLRKGLCMVYPVRYFYYIFEC